MPRPQHEEIASGALEDVMAWLGFDTSWTAPYLSALRREKRAIFKRARP